MTQNPSSLTIVIAHYNHGHVIGDQLDSIFAQTVQPERILILDDASTDDSASRIEGLVAAHRSVEFIRRRQNSGPLVLVNEGLRLATSKYVCFLAADDTELPTFFEKSIAQLEQHSGAALCSAVSFVQHTSGDSTWPEPLQYPAKSNAYIPPDRALELFMKYENWIVCNSTVYRRELLLAEGGFDPKLRNYADGFLCRVLALKHGACFVPEILTVFRLSDSGYSMSDALSEERSGEILAYSSSLMKTKYASVFPEKLAARNNARMFYRLLVTKLNHFQQSVRLAVEAAHPMFGSSILLAVLKLALGLVRLLCFAVLRPYDITQRILLKLASRTPHLPHR